jgi:glycosyltransferase involved in cell wall biosynthesis
MEKPRRKILIIGNSLAFTGAFKSALQEAKALSDDYEVVFVVPSKSILTPVLEKEGYRYYKLPMMEIGRSLRKVLLYFPVLLLNMMRLKLIVDREQVDVIHANDFYNLLGVSIKLLGYRGSQITHVRLLPSSLPGFLQRWWTIVAQRYSDWVVCVSDAVLNEMPPKENTVRIYNAISFEEKIKTPIARDSSITLLLYLSNYIRGKGHQYAIEAFAQAYQRNPSLRLRFAGGDMGLRKNKTFKQELIQRVTELGISEVVIFTEFVEDVELEIKKSDIVLNFSEAESFSMTCAEASFFGRPVIATRCGGPEEIIQHYQTGLLVENRNIKEMEEAILKLSSDKNLMEEMGNRGRQIVREKFSEDIFRKEFTRLFKQVLHEE